MRKTYIQVEVIVGSIDFSFIESYNYRVIVVFIKFDQNFLGKHLVHHYGVIVMIKLKHLSYKFRTGFNCPLKMNL